MHLKPIILAALMAAMPALTQAAPMTIGPGNASPISNGAAGGLVVMSQTFTSAGPGIYTVDTFSAAFLHFGQQTAATMITPLVLKLLGGGYELLAVGAATTISDAAAYQSYTFGGQDTFTLTANQSLTVGAYMSGGNYGLQESTAAGYGKHINDSFPGGLVVGHQIGYGSLGSRSEANTLAVGVTVDTPEPASMALLGAGLLGLAGTRRRRG